MTAYFPAFGVLFDTIRAASVALPLSLMCLIIMLGFMMAGHLWFGMKVTDYNTFGGAAMSLFLFMMNISSYDDLEEGNPIAAPLFYYPA